MRRHHRRSSTNLPSIIQQPYSSPSSSQHYFIANQQFFRRTLCSSSSRNSNDKQNACNFTAIDGKSNSIISKTKKNDDEDDDNAATTSAARATTTINKDDNNNNLLFTTESKIQLSVLITSGMILQLGIGMIVPCLPSYATSVGLAESSVGTIVAVPALARALLNLPAGHIVDVVGRKRPWMIGCIIDGVGCLATASATGLTSMINARLVMGSGTAIAGAASSAYTMDVVAKFPQHKGRMIGAINTATSLAWMAGPVVGGILAERGGIVLPFVLVGGYLLALAPIIHYMLPETRLPIIPQESKLTTTLSSFKLRPILKETKASFVTLLKDPDQRAVVLIQCAIYTIWATSLAVVPLYVTSKFGYTPADLGILYSVMSALGIVGGPLGGYVADTIGRREGIFIGSAITALSIATLPLVSTTSELMAVAAIMGLGESFLMSTTAALSNDITPSNLRGAQAAMLAQTGDVTFVIMPIALALIATNVGYDVAFMTTATLIAVSNIGFAILAKKTRKK
jgi:MFS family permease